MWRPVALALLLAATAGAGEPGLLELLIPDHPEFHLRPHTWPEYRALPPGRRLEARGVDLSEWQDPRFEAAPRQLRPGADQQARYWWNAHRNWQLTNERIHDPGYRHRERLAAKQRTLSTLLRRSEGEVFLELAGCRPMVEREWMRFDEGLGKLETEYAAVLDPVQLMKLARDKPARVRSIRWDHPRLIQRLYAVRHSDERFHRWMAKELGTRLSAMPPATAQPFLAALAQGLKSPDPRHRLWCADLLGWADQPLACAALEAALQRERLSETRAQLLTMRARTPGRGLDRILRARLADRAWNVRVAAAIGLRQLGVDESQRIAASELALSHGRLRKELRELAEPEVEPEQDVVVFYGIPAQTRRVIYCLDISPSMDFPLDGLGGTKEPRFDYTRRELIRSLDRMPESVHFDIVVYSGTVSWWKEKLVPATPKNKEAVRKFVDGLRFRTGGTNIHGALKACLMGGRSGAPMADTVFFLTDGEPTVGALVDAVQILHDITERNRGRHVIFHTVGVSDEQDAAFLTNLAAQNGGRFVAQR